MAARRTQRESTVFASGHSARPPSVAAFVAKSKAFTLKVSEPARINLTATGRHRRAVQWSRLPPGQRAVTSKATIQVRR
jgi:hypothetical protein